MLCWVPFTPGFHVVLLCKNVRPTNMSYQVILKNRAPKIPCMYGGQLCHCAASVFRHYIKILCLVPPLLVVSKVSSLPEYSPLASELNNRSKT